MARTAREVGPHWAVMAALVFVSMFMTVSMSMTVTMTTLLGPRHAVVAGRKAPFTISSPQSSAATSKILHFLRVRVGLATALFSRRVGFFDFKDVRVRTTNSIRASAGMTITVSATAVASRKVGMVFSSFWSTSGVSKPVVVVMMRSKEAVVPVSTPSFLTSLGWTTEAEAVPEKPASATMMMI